MCPGCNPQCAPEVQELLCKNRGRASALGSASFLTSSFKILKALKGHSTVSRKRMRTHSKVQTDVDTLCDMTNIRMVKRNKYVGKHVDSGLMFSMCTWVDQWMLKHCNTTSSIQPLCQPLCFSFLSVSVRQQTNRDTPSCQHQQPNEWPGQWLESRMGLKHCAFGLGVGRRMGGCS